MLILKEVSNQKDFVKKIYKLKTNKEMKIKNENLKVFTINYEKGTVAGIIFKHNDNYETWFDSPEAREFFFKNFQFK